jgi:hypothetical protein
MNVRFVFAASTDRRKPAVPQISAFVMVAATIDIFNQRIITGWPKHYPITEDDDPPNTEHYPCALFCGRNKVNLLKEALTQLR